VHGCRQACVRKRQLMSIVAKLSPISALGLSATWFMLVARQQRKLCRRFVDNVRVYDEIAT